MQSPDQPRVTLAVDEMCEKSGALNYVGPDLYQLFLDADENVIRSMIEIIIADQTEGVQNEQRIPWPSKSAAANTISNVLGFLAIGRVKFSEEHRLLLFKPIGPFPDDNTQDLIDTRIQQAASLIEEMLDDALRSGNAIIAVT